MRSFNFKTLAIAAALLAPGLAIAAGNTVFFTNKGDLTFPFVPPSTNGSTPGTIDNMDIGGATPKAGSFTTLKSTDGLVCVTYNQVLTAAIGDATLFIATRPYILVSANQVHAIAAGGASLLQITKDTGTSAPGAGTDLLTNNTNTGFNLNATANTVQIGTLVAAATRTLAAGDRLAVDFSAAIQSSSGISVTACLAPQ